MEDNQITPVIPDEEIVTEEAAAEEASESTPGFASLLTGVSEEVRRAVEEMGYETPTPIQQLTIPDILKGSDLVGQAQTGTGKTAAYGIPLVNMIDTASTDVQALVLCPTRELALQVGRELSRMAKYRRGLRILPVYGGQPIEVQLRMLRLGMQVIVGTPGRVIDHINRGTLDLKNVKYLVLDEADEMLDMGFRDDIRLILENTPAERQTVLFSATMPQSILALAKSFQKDSVYQRVPASEMTVNTIDQVYVQVIPGQKNTALGRLLDVYDPELSLVFVNTKLGAEEVVTYLQQHGYPASALHGDMRQVERDSIMARFRSGIIKILVATDVAARGLDVKGIDAVINYDIPQDVEQYVHRIGRTGRAGKLGKAFTLVVGHELARMWEIRRTTNAKILSEKAPLRSDVMRKRIENFTKTLTEGEQAPEETYLSTAAALLAENDPAQLVARLLAHCVKQPDGPEDLTPPLPKPKPPVQRPPLPAQNRFGRPAAPAQGRFDRAAGNRPFRSDRPYGKPASTDRTYGKPANADHPYEGSGKAATAAPNRADRPFSRTEKPFARPGRSEDKRGAVRTGKPPVEPSRSYGKYAARNDSRKPFDPARAHGSSRPDKQHS